MNEIYEEAASNVGQTSGIMKLLTFRGTEATHGPFAKEVERLLMLRPELQADYIRGN
jgi:hypothetical protein